MSTEYYRLDFNLVYTATSGMRDWAKAQLDDRLSTSIHAIGNGRPYEELTEQEKQDSRAFEQCHVTNGEDADGNPSVYGMLAFPMNGGLDAQAFCKDAYDTLAATTAWMVQDGATSTLHYHICDHEKNKRGGCVPEEKMNG